MAKNPEKSIPYLIGKYSLLLCIVTVCYGGIYFFFLNAKSIAFTSAVCAAVFALTPLVYRYSRSTSLAVNNVLCSAILLIVYTALYTGGSVSPVLFWVTAIPLIGGFLIRQTWSSVNCLILSLFCFIFVLGHDRIFGRLPSEVDDNLIKFAQYFAIIGMAATNTAISHMFKHEITRECQEIEESRSALLKTRV